MHKMKKTIMIFTISLLSLSCGAETEGKTDKNPEKIEVKSAVNTEKTAEKKADFEKDWERFKTAVLNNDLQGVGAFASSDAIDSENLLLLFSDDTFKKILKDTKFADLKEVTNDSGKYLEFSATVSGSDDEGTIYESGVYLYFTTANNKLELEYYLAAGQKTNKLKHYEVVKISDFISWNQIPKISEFDFGEFPFTQFSAYYDNEFFHFRFEVSTKEALVFIKENNKIEVLQSERVEIFFRKDEKLQPYYCLEIDANGRLFDYKANFHREFEYNWNFPEKLKIKSEKIENSYSIESKISLKTLIELNLLSGNKMQVGLFRAQCIEIKEDKASFRWHSWIKANTEKPDFHIPEVFGTFLFV